MLVRHGQCTPIGVSSGLFKDGTVADGFALETLGGLHVQGSGSRRDSRHTARFVSATIPRPTRCSRCTCRSASTIVAPIWDCGMPVFRGLIGPMPEGKTVIRYESPEVFESLTKEWSSARRPPPGQAAIVASAI